jgi:DNA (cytosine-5)-methyltransferase 1
MNNPSPEEVKAARAAAGLTQAEAAAVIYCGWRAWQEWEAGNRKMHPAFWELWALKVGSDESSSSA